MIPQAMKIANSTIIQFASSLCFISMIFPFELWYYKKAENLIITQVDQR